MYTFCQSRLPARSKERGYTGAKDISVEYAGSVSLSRKGEGEVDRYGGFSDTALGGGDGDCVCDITDSSALREAALGARD